MLNQQQRKRLLIKRDCIPQIMQWQYIPCLVELSNIQPYLVGTYEPINTWCTKRTKGGGSMNWCSFILILFKHPWTNASSKRSSIYRTSTNCIAGDGQVHSIASCCMTDNFNSVLRSWLGRWIVNVLYGNRFIELCYLGRSVGASWRVNCERMCNVSAITFECEIDSVTLINYN